MAGFGRGIADFVNGALSGVQLRQQWDDRKRKQKLDDEQMQWEREDRATAAEDRKRKIAAEDEDAAWVREDRQHTRAKRGIEEAARKKAQAIADADQANLADAFESSQKAYEAESNAAAKASVPLSATMPNVEVQPLPGGALEKALQQTPDERPAQKPALGVIPALRQKDDNANAEPPAAPAAPSAPMVNAAPADPQQQASAIVPQGRSILSAINPFGVANAAEVPPELAPAPAPESQPPAQAPAPLVGSPNHQPEPVGDLMATPSSPRRAAMMRRSAARETGTAPDPMEHAPATYSPPTLVYGPKPTPAPTPETAAPQAAPETQQAAAPGGAEASAPSAPVKAPVPSAAPQTAQPVTPSLEAAAATAPRQMVDTNGMRRARGVTGAIQAKEPPPSERQVKARTFLQIYRAEGIPKVVEHYLKQGRIDEAEKFDKWARSEDTKEGQMAWAQGVHAAMVGDEDGFLDHMIDAYNADGYYDDGMEIVRKGSGFTRDDKGNVTGGQLVIRDKRTGKTRTQTFDDSQDLWELGIQTLSPENVFETGVSEMKAALEFQQKQTEADLKQQRDLELEAVKAGAKGKSPEEEIAATYKALSDEDPYGNGFNALPEAEKQKAVLERIQAVKAMALGRVPVTRSQIPVAPVDF